VDIYLPDVKFYHRPEAFRYSGAANYPEVNRAALGEMFRQAGPLKLDEDGLAVSGVLIRHLVLPGNLAQTDLILAWLAAEFGNDIYLSLMAQYGPAYRVVSEPGSFPELARPLTANEYETAIDLAISLGFDNVFIQEIDAAEHYRPDFDRPGVFK